MWWLSAATFRLLTMITILLILSLLTDYRVYPDGVVLETTIDHQFLPEKDTVIATHWHKIENKFYIITKDSTELWVDHIKEIYKPSKEK